MVGEVSGFLLSQLSLVVESLGSFSFGESSSGWNFKDWLRSRKSEITDFNVAVGIDQKIGWLDVSVDDVSRVHEVHGTKHAVDHGYHVLFGELELWHGLEDLFHVSLHEL